MEEYNKRINEISTEITTLGMSSNVNDLQNTIKELRYIIKEIQTVAFKASKICNTASDILLNKTNGMYLDGFINPAPKYEDISILEHKFLHKMRKENVTDNNTTDDNTTDDNTTDDNTTDDNKTDNNKKIKVPSLSVKSVDAIPVSYLYYVSDIKKFAININGIIFVGDFGNIVNKGTKKSRPCLNKKCISKTCPFYHKYREEDTRNFTVGSWIYSGTDTTYFSRQIGGANTITNDIERTCVLSLSEEIETRESQLMHDLLTFIILHDKDMIEKYRHWF